MMRRRRRKRRIDDLPVRLIRLLLLCLAGAISYTVGNDATDSIVAQILRVLRFFWTVGGAAGYRSETIRLNAMRGGAAIFEIFKLLLLFLLCTATLMNFSYFWTPSSTVIGISSVSLRPTLLFLLLLLLTSASLAKAKRVIIMITTITTTSKFTRNVVEIAAVLSATQLRIVPFKFKVTRELTR